MKDVLEFMGEHPVLTWFLAWGLWPICTAIATMVATPFRYAFLAYNRRLRHLNIRAHGWPTSPLMDADGDVVHPPAPNQGREDT